MDEFHELREEFLILKATVSEWMLSTTEYRKNLCEKIDRIMDRMSKLPCEKRLGWYESIGKQLMFMWVILSAIALAIFAEWVKQR